MFTYLNAITKKPTKRHEYLLKTLIISLNTSDMMTTNNLREIHGHTAYDVNSSDRHSQLTYMDYDDVLSRIHMIIKAS